MWIFGVWKGKLFAVSMDLHNFIRLSNLWDVNIDLNYSTDNVPTEDFDSNEDKEHNNIHVHYMEGIRDQISAFLWDSR